MVETQLKTWNIWLKKTKSSGWRTWIIWVKNMNLLAQNTWDSQNLWLKCMKLALWLFEGVENSPSICSIVFESFLTCSGAYLRNLRTNVSCRSPGHKQRFEAQLQHFQIVKSMNVQVFRCSVKYRRLAWSQIDQEYWCAMPCRRPFGPPCRIWLRSLLGGVNTF